MSEFPRAAIVGWHTTAFGDRFDRSWADLMLEAAAGALARARVEPARVDCAYLGTYMPMAWGYDGVSGPAVTEPLGIQGIPVTRVVNYCATGMEAVRHAAMAIAAGEAEVALAVGVEKMREVSGRGSLVAQHVERGHPLYCKGRTAPGMFALVASRYLHEHGLSREVLADVAVKNHAHGARNPKAHFRKAITRERALSAPPVAEPLHLYDCCPTTDGAAACVLVRADRAREFTDRFALLRGIATVVEGGHYTQQMLPTFDFLGFPATRKAARRAYQRAGLRDVRREAQVVECHDCFTITEIVNLEDLGIADPGRGWTLAGEGVTALGGALPVNTSGGLKSCGHPIGASGVRMVNHIVEQVLGEAGDMQVPGARTGIAHTLGGPGAVACVCVISQ